MLFGDNTNRPLPRQDSAAIMLHRDRYERAAAALREWSEVAKRCVDYFEGKQWAAEDLRLLESQKRPALTINKIKPLVQLVLGYHLNNRTDIRYLPGNDSVGNAEVARVLTHLSKSISELNQLPYLSGEVFLDGVLTGRGYYDVRIDQEHNLLGDVRIKALDPFTVYPDPDGDQYDLNTCNDIRISRFVSIEEIEFFYGRQAANLVQPLMGGSYAAFPTSIYDGLEEITPWRRFGGDGDPDSKWTTYGQTWFDWVDTARKTVRMLEIQHYVLTRRWFFVDLNTGDKKAIPDNWGRNRVNSTLSWAAEKGHPLVAQKLPTRRLRNTHMVGDVIVYDDWSPYDTMTIVPFFPYFRRGKTRGMVEDLIGPQDEVNKRRSARMNIIGRSSNGGWMYPKGSLDAQQIENLRLHGSTPGVQIEYDSKEGTLNKPEQIMPATSPIAQTQLEDDSEADLKEIAGINDSALGMIDKVQSGRAIEARQRQTIVGLEGFIQNYSRTMELVGRKQIELIQQWYTEERIIRVIGVNGTPESIIINQKTAEGTLYNVTVGKYSVAIDESPLAKSFLEGQFEELMRMKGELMMPIPDEFIIDASSIGRKEELKNMMMIARAQEAAMAAAGVQPPSASGPGPGGSKVGPDGGSLPGGTTEPGAPPQLAIAG